MTTRTRDEQLRVRLDMKDLIHFDACHLDHLGPAFGVLGHEPSEVGSRATGHHAAHVDDARAGTGGPYSSTPLGSRLPSTGTSRGLEELLHLLELLDRLVTAGSRER